MTAYERLVDALRAHGRDTKDSGAGHAQAQCPAHDDRRPSLSVGPRRDAKGIVVHCHAGCPPADVLAALGLSMRDLFDDDDMAAVYAPRRDYHYADGRIVHRKPDKSFPQSGKTTGNSLFRADRVGDAEIVYVVEGEKDVEAIELAGGAAVCPAMGAGKARLADWSPLRGKSAVIVADKDEPGRRHAAEVARLLKPVAAAVKIVEAAAGKDAADHFASDKTLDEFRPVVDADDEPVDGAELLDDLHDAFRRYVAFPDRHSSVAATLWTAATHCLPAFECAPRLVATSPEKRCGKSRLLDIIGGTCHDPLITVNATVAAIFRSIGVVVGSEGGDAGVVAHPPTLVIDEADTIFGSKKVADQHEDLRALLNAGHQRGRPALRCVGPAQLPTKFNTFCMAAIAGIGRLPDTITDRAVNLSMRRRAADEVVAQFRSRRDGPKLSALRDRLAAWAAPRIDSIGAAQPDMPVEDRAADTWEPLIAVADAAGGHWPATARAACTALVAGAAEYDADSGSLAVKLLADIRSVFADQGAPFLSSADLVSALRKVEESPWDDFDLNARKLARHLRQFGIKPGRAERNTVRGYAVDAFADAFGRYVCPHPSTPSSTGFDQGKPVDGQNFVDTSMCPQNLSVHTKNTVPPAVVDMWTHVDGYTDQNGYDALFDEPSAPAEGRPGARGTRLTAPEARRPSKRTSGPANAQPRAESCVHCGEPTVAGQLDPQGRPAHLGCQQRRAGVGVLGESW